MSVSMDRPIAKSKWRSTPVMIGAGIIGVLLLAIVTAIPVGILTGMNRVAQAIVDPLIEFYRPIPPLAYLPLIVIWCGIGRALRALMLLIAGGAFFFVARRRKVRFTA